MAEQSKAGNLPRDAATLVIVDDRQPERLVLLGKRRQSQVFAPGKYVFPGGSLDPSDADVRHGSRLRDSERYALLHDLRPQSIIVTPETFALAAIRETFEETGILIGGPNCTAPALAPESWDELLAKGYQPRLDALIFLARAVTPPGRSRRFDARFFLASATDIGLRIEANDGEFHELVWVSFAKARTMDLHGVTRSVIEEADHYLSLQPSARAVAPVPYFFQADGAWRRGSIARRPDPGGA